MEPDLKPLTALLKKHRHELEQSHLRLLVRFAPAPEDVDFGALYDPRQYRVDITKRALALLDEDGEIAFVGPIQIAGTYNDEDETFLWAWGNSSIPAAAYDKVRAACQNLPELKPLLAVNKFTTDMTFAGLLCDYIAGKMDYFGVHRAEHPGQPVVFVAIEKLAPDVDETYCVLCFGNTTNTEALVDFADGLALCKECLDQLGDIFAESGDAGGASDIWELSPCVVCGTTEKLVHGSHAAVCRPCYERAKSALP